MHEGRRTPVRRPFFPAVILGLAVALPGPGHAADPAATGMAHCRTLADPAARLRCYDALPGPDPASAAPKADGPPPAGPSPPADLFGLDPVARSQILEASAGLATPSFIDARVEQVRTHAGGRLELVLDNGQRWLQSESVSLRIKAGDRVRIRAAALGSHLLQKDATGRGFRVRRLDPAAD